MFLSSTKKTYFIKKIVLANIYTTVDKNIKIKQQSLTCRYQSVNHAHIKNLFHDGLMMKLAILYVL